VLRSQPTKPSRARGSSPRALEQEAERATAALTAWFENPSSRRVDVRSLQLGQMKWARAREIGIERFTPALRAHDEGRIAFRSSATTRPPRARGPRCRRARRGGSGRERVCPPTQQRTRRGELGRRPRARVPEPSSCPCARGQG
jgi:hypothetical protein